MIAVAGGMRVLVATRPVDFRKRMDGLAAVVKEHLEAEPYSGAIFVFRAKRADRVKLIRWDGTGLCLFAKRLERLVTVKTKRGFARLEWQKLRERNEALDCRVYARAAAWIAGADRWTEGKWRDLERQLGIDGDDDKHKHQHDIAAAAPVAGNVRRAPERRGRRVFRSSYLT